MKYKNYLLKVGRGIFCLFVVLLGLSILRFFEPLVVQKITDGGLTKKNLKVILFFSIVLLCLGLFSALFRLLQSLIYTKLYNKVTANLYNSIFEKLLKLPIKYFEGKSSSEIVNSVSVDINNISLFIKNCFSLLLTNIFLILGGIIGLISINYILATVMLILIPIKIVIVKKMSKNKEKASQKMIQSQQEYFKWFGYQMDGIREIKLWNLFEHKAKKFKGKYEEVLKMNLKNELLNSIQLNADYLMEIISKVLVYMLSGYFICINKMTLGEVLAFISYSTYITGPLDILINMKYLYASVKPSVSRINEILETEEEDLERSKVCMNLEDINNLQISNLCFGYAKRKQIFDNVNIELKKGKIYGFVGKNGSGKTTLMNLILGLYLPSKGEIEIDKITSDEIGLNQWRSLFSVVSQYPYLFQGTIIENITMYNHYSEQEINKVSMESGVYEFASKLNGHLEFTISEQGNNLSGGEKRKISMARALIKKSPIIIFDEATSNYDEESMKNFRNQLKELKKNRIILIVTHEKSLVGFCDEVYELDCGHITKKGED